MQSSNDYNPEVRAANNLRKIIARLKTWEEKQVKRAILLIYTDDRGRVVEVRESLKIDN
jgi:hypothetical protein